MYFFFSLGGDAILLCSDFIFLFSFRALAYFKATLLGQGAAFSQKGIRKTGFGCGVKGWKEVEWETVELLRQEFPHGFSLHGISLLYLAIDFIFSNSRSKNLQWLFMTQKLNLNIFSLAPEPTHHETHLQFPQIPLPCLAQLRAHVPGAHLPPISPALLLLLSHTPPAGKLPGRPLVICATF